MSEEKIDTASGAAERDGYPVTVSCRELFLGFLSVGIVGFGGVMPWIRRMVVEQRRWLSEEEFLHLLSLCQLLPGANVGNFAVCLGTRFAGLRGALSAVSGLYLAPFCIVLLLAIFYSSYSHLPVVENMFRGVSAAAAGLVISMGLMIAVPVCRTVHAVAFTLLAIIGIVFLKFPLLWVIVALAPLSILTLVIAGRR
jgi:Chromate transport protein ChrA